MQDEIGAPSDPHAAAARLTMLDVPSAILAAERAAGSKVLGDPFENADASRVLSEAIAIGDGGERAAVIAPAERLASARDSLRKLAATRTGIVAHAIAGHGAEELAALADLGWGVLSASGPEDSFDLTLVARRAAEDAGVPFIVLHSLARPNLPAGRAMAMVALPPPAAVEGFVGPASRVKDKGAPAHATTGERAFAERVPFALGSALREYSNVSGRRHDTFDKLPLGESPLVIVGTGPVGDALYCATTELRARGFDVGAVHITALRPFPGPRLVKALARALAVTVLEPVDEPFAHGAFLARDVKSAFTDALTWVPGFPGIGRIPKLFVGASGSAFDLADLSAVCDNMLADERGRRVFSFIDVEHTLPRARPSIPSSIVPEPPSDEKRDDGPSSREVVRRPEGRPEREIAVRFVLDDAGAAESVLTTVGEALAQAVGLRTHGIISGAGGSAPADGSPGGLVVLDVVATRDQARGGMARRAPRLVVASSKGVASAGAVVALADGALLGVLGAESSSALPEAARTIVRERRVRALPLAVGDGGVAATCAGATLAVASRAFRTPLEANALPESAGGAAARRAFEATRDTLAQASG